MRAHSLEARGQTQHQFSSTASGSALLRALHRRPGGIGGAWARAAGAESTGAEPCRAPPGPTLLARPADHLQPRQPVQHRRLANRFKEISRHVGKAGGQLARGARPAARQREVAGVGEAGGEGQPL